MSKLVDPHGRHIRKLRLSLLDACNFRCFYCLPEKPQFMSSRQWLSVEEIRILAGQLVELGIEEIRLTGGEPTLRKEFREIVEEVSSLPVKKLGMTTNGFKLLELLPFLQKTRCEHLNISFDSLNEERFRQITKSNSFKEVLAGILKAKELGFTTKVNVVLLKGINDHEILDYVAFSARYDIEVRFLELMKIGMVCGFSQDHFMSAAEAIQRIQERESLCSQKVEHDSTSFNFTTKRGGRIGFIASETRPFCNSCSRLRLTCDGQLRPCLMANSGVSVRGYSTEELSHTLQKVMRLKPTGRLEKTSVRMNELGG